MYLLIYLRHRVWGYGFTAYRATVPGTNLPMCVLLLVVWRRLVCLCVCFCISFLRNVIVTATLGNRACRRVLRVSRHARRRAGAATCFTEPRALSRRRRQWARFGAWATFQYFCFRRIEMRTCAFRGRRHVRVVSEARGQSSSRARVGEQRRRAMKVAGWCRAAILFFNKTFLRTTTADSCHD